MTSGQMHATMDRDDAQARRDDSSHDLRLLFSGAKPDAGARIEGYEGPWFG